MVRRGKENLIRGTEHLPYQDRLNSCCGLALTGSSAPHSRSLTLPQWDGGEKHKDKSEKTPELRQRQFDR